MLLNFPLPSSGMLDNEELAILGEITRWMAVNSEAICATRPWKTFGSGATSSAAAAKRTGSDHHVQEAFNERNRRELGPQDVRYVSKGKVLYAFSMGWGGREVIFPELAPGGNHQVGKIQAVTLLGFKGKVSWKQEAGGLRVQLPQEKPSDHAVVFKVEGV